MEIHMKKFAIVALVMLAGSVMAQGFGLPIVQTAEPVDPMAGVLVSGGISTGGGSMMDLTVYGVRASVGVIENLSVAVDAGMMSLDVDAAGVDSDASLGFAVGVQYALTMLDLPVDVAVRGTYSYAKPEASMGGFTAEMDMSAFTVLGVASAPVDAVPGLDAYGVVGFMSGIGDAAGSELVLGGGANYALPVEGLALYGELAFIDGLLFGGGVRFRAAL
jgi:hypothetical protein